MTGAEMEMDIDYNEMELPKDTDKMEFEGSGVSLLRSSLKKSSLCRARAPLPFNKRKKVSFDGTANLGTGGGRRARSLSPPSNNRKTSFKHKRQSDDYVGSNISLPSTSKDADTLGNENRSTNFHYMGEDNME